jgi:predicted ester cyclase
VSIKDQAENPSSTLCHFLDDTLPRGGLVADDWARRAGKAPWSAMAVEAGSADFHNEIVELVCDGGRAAARLRFTGTHTGPLLGLPATQRRFEYAGAAFSPQMSGG